MYCGCSSRKRAIVNVKYFSDACAAAFESIFAEILVRINYNLFLGHFELDFTDGEIRFKTSLIYADAKVTPKMIDSFITSNIAAIDAYFELLTQFVTGKLNASEMVAKIKSES